MHQRGSTIEVYGFVAWHPSCGPYPCGGADEFTVHTSAKAAEMEISTGISISGFPKEVEEFRQKIWSEQQAEGWIVKRVKILEYEKATSSEAEEGQ